MNEQLKVGETGSEWPQVAMGLREVKARMAVAALAAGRRAGGVMLVAVSKTYPASAIRTAALCGQRDFGENYVQEACEKQAMLTDLQLVWHFIGPIQSNKTREIATHFDWVHGVEREKIARRLSEQRPTSKPALNVCLQVNISGEASKSGVAPDALDALAAQVEGLPGLKLRGLMAIPDPGDNPQSGFRQMRALLEELNTKGHALDTLSMGMSGDFETAIAEGATIIRVGSAIFGKRSGKKFYAT